MITQEKEEVEIAPKITPKKEAIFSIDRLLKEGSPTELDFIYLRKSFIHKSFDYFITLGNKSSPFNSIYESTMKFDMSFSHGIRLVNEWEKLGLLKKSPSGDKRSIKIALTKKGQSIREKFLKIQGIINSTEKELPEIVRKIRKERGLEKNGKNL